MNPQSRSARDTHPKLENTSPPLIGSQDTISPIIDNEMLRFEKSMDFPIFTGFHHVQLCEDMAVRDGQPSTHR